MSDIKTREAALIEDFEVFDDWTDRYAYLIELGEKMPALPDEYKIESNKVKGCQSQVWLIVRSEGDRLFFQADSDSAITKGLIALLVNLFSGQLKSDIISADLIFVDKIGLSKHLSISRANGFASMLKKLRELANA